MPVLSLRDQRLVVGEFTFVPFRPDSVEGFDELQWALPGGATRRADEIRVWAECTGRAFQQVTTGRKT